MFKNIRKNQTYLTPAFIFNSFCLLGLDRLSVADYFLMIPIPIIRLSNTNWVGGISFLCEYSRMRSSHEMRGENTRNGWALIRGWDLFVKTLVMGEKLDKKIFSRGGDRFCILNKWAMTREWDFLITWHGEGGILKKTMRFSRK